jgi:serpin B
MRIVRTFAILLSATWAISGGGAAANEASLGADVLFALDLYEESRNLEGNLCLSPSSLSSALAMTLEGARGRTAEQIAEILRVNPSRLDSRRGPVLAGHDRQLFVANALWGQLGFGFRPEYVTTLRNRYDAGFDQLDFTRDADAGRRAINEWTAQHTDRRIDGLLAEGDLDSDTVLVLTHAVYFDGRWAVPFDETRTAAAEFRPPDGPPITVPFMTQTDKLRYVNLERLAVVELPYEGGRFAMVLLLPHRDEALGTVEDSLTQEHLTIWLEGLAPTRVRVRLPRFTIEARFDLTETLRAMGMVDAFTGRADFSGISPDGGLFISKVVQSARVDVDESGTEGAAASGVVVKKGPHPAEFVVDRPFLFLVRDRSNGQVLFIGRVTNPAGA